MPPEDKLKQTHTKITRPRTLVLDYLAKQQKPKTIQEIVRGLRRTGIDQASIYRTIELLLKLEVIFEELILGERKFYAADSPHHHAVCRRCRTIACLPCTTEIPAPKGFTQVIHQVSITGLCQQCAH
ncbi:MAG: transcriptional repressor [Candidatus Kerfeldbacteria bacterium]|nr:transcriptional repressor [Candidatus Kerfeldbacteria bacterium]